MDLRSTSGANIRVPGMARAALAVCQCDQMTTGDHLVRSWHAFTQRWIGVDLVILVGLGVVVGVTATRNRDSPS